MWHDSFIWHSFTYDMTCICDSFMCDSFIRDMTDFDSWRLGFLVSWVTWHESFICDSFICDMTLSYMTPSYVTRLNLIRSALAFWWRGLCDMTRSHVTHSFVAWLSYATCSWCDSFIRDVTDFGSWCLGFMVGSAVWHDSFICNSSICNMPLSYMTPSYVTWLTLIISALAFWWRGLCDTARSYVTHSFVTWLSYVTRSCCDLRDVTDFGSWCLGFMMGSAVWHDSFMCDPFICDMTFTCDSNVTWLTLVRGALPF